MTIVVSPSPAPRYNAPVNDLELSLDPPFFLVAMPQVLDPFFHRTVVVVLEHHEGGSFGYIVNRPTEFSMPELLGGLNMNWGGSPNAIGWFGGPVQPQMGTALFEKREDSEHSDDEVIRIQDNLHLTAELSVIRSLAPDPPDRFRLILGYSGWGPGQLDEEMNRNDWLVAPFDPDIIFTDTPDEAWVMALESIDVKPELLPTWTTGDPSSSN